ncbi:AfsR/SARP family transcriptional regulator [Nonomuraea sp. NPDC046802]|uniref:AfsR/SARP family transcriptional regulator n=1 Tax=Nonomuraea sp. NPDC046802 TaxID=3154919 RepID=UPI0033F96638
MVPSASKPRQVFALLALRGDRVVQAGTLMEELWGDDIPRSASTTLQTYVLHIRYKIAEALPPGSGRSPKELLATCFGGYLLKLGAGRFDLREFEEQATAGGIAYESGDLQAATAIFDRALSLWDGGALVDLPHGRILKRDVVSMEHLRMSVLEQRLDACLRLGRHAASLPELSALVDEHDLHEGFRAQFMLALYRTGNVGRALEEFHRLRAKLVAELGIEPSARLRRLHQAILSGDPMPEPGSADFQRLIG